MGSVRIDAFTLNLVGEEDGNECGADGHDNGNDFHGHVVGEDF